MKYAFASGTAHNLTSVWLYDTKEEALERQKRWHAYIICAFPSLVRTEHCYGNRLEYKTDDTNTAATVWSDIIETSD